MENDQYIRITSLEMSRDDNRMKKVFKAIMLLVQGVKRESFRIFGKVYQFIAELIGKIVTF